MEWHHFVNLFIERFSYIYISDVELVTDI